MLCSSPPPPPLPPSTSPRRLLYRRRRPPRSTFFSSGAKGGARLPILGARAARALHSVKASPLVRLHVPPAILGRARLRQDHRPLVDQLLDPGPAVLQNLLVEAKAAIRGAGLAAAIPPETVQLLHIAPGLRVAGSAEGAARRASSVPGCHGNCYGEFLNSSRAACRKKNI